MTDASTTRRPETPRTRPPHPRPLLCHYYFPFGRCPRRASSQEQLPGRMPRWPCRNGAHMRRVTAEATNPIRIGACEHRMNRTADRLRYEYAVRNLIPSIILCISRGSDSRLNITPGDHPQGGRFSVAGGGPRKTTNSPSAIFRLKACTTVRPPYFFKTFFNSTSAITLPVISWSHQRLCRSLAGHLRFRNGRPFWSAPFSPSALTLNWIYQYGSTTFEIVKAIFTGSCPPRLAHRALRQLAFRDLPTFHSSRAGRALAG